MMFMWRCGVDEVDKFAMIARSESHFLKQFGYLRRKMPVFQLLHLAGDIFGRIAGIYRTAGLKDDVSFVIGFVHVVDRYSTFFLSGRLYSLVYMPAVHALSTESGQKSRVNVDDPSPKGLHQVFRNQPQKTRQNDQINIMTM